MNTKEIINLTVADLQAKLDIAGKSATLEDNTFVIVREGLSRDEHYFVYGLLYPDQLVKNPDPSLMGFRVQRIQDLEGLVRLDGPAAKALVGIVGGYALPYTTWLKSETESLGRYLETFQSLAARI